jgi:DNA polymerase I-like protein with 3'-5' exonuclease and polymerase domains
MGASKNLTDWYIMLNVHDQITVSAPRAQAKEAMRVLKECMESVEFDVPMLSEGSVSDTNWDELKDTDKKGKELSWPLKRAA